jgi:hypothetical protein
MTPSCSRHGWLQLGQPQRDDDHPRDQERDEQRLERHEQAFAAIPGLDHEALARQVEAAAPVHQGLARPARASTTPRS